MDELDPSLVASESRRLHSQSASASVVDVLLVGDRIAVVNEDLLLLVDNGAVGTTLRDDRAKGLWKQNIVSSSGGWVLF